jgi:hypothetical protein
VFDTPTSFAADTFVALLVRGVHNEHLCTKEFLSIALGHHLRDRVRPLARRWGVHAECALLGLGGQARLSQIDPVLGSKPREAAHPEAGQPSPRVRDVCLRDPVSAARSNANPCAQTSWACLTTPQKQRNHRLD